MVDRGQTPDSKGDAEDYERRTKEGNAGEDHGRLSKSTLAKLDRTHGSVNDQWHDNEKDHVEETSKDNDGRLVKSRCRLVAWKQRFAAAELHNVPAENEQKENQKQPGKANQTDRRNANGIDSARRLIGSG